MAQSFASKNLRAPDLTGPFRSSNLLIQSCKRLTLSGALKVSNTQVFEIFSDYV